MPEPHLGGLWVHELPTTRSPQDAAGVISTWRNYSTRF
jgi:hypothetical protein